MICKTHANKKSNPQCLPCFLTKHDSIGTVSLSTDKATYLVQTNDGVVACRQGTNGWYEVAPPRKQ